jgi:hypothetical protein
MRLFGYLSGVLFRSMDPWRAPDPGTGQIENRAMEKERGVCPEEEWITG